MIENFTVITGDGLHARVDVGGDSFYMKDEPREIVIEIVNTYNTGLQWEHNGKVIRLLNDLRIDGYPSVDLNYVIAVYYNSDEYPNPNNAVVYNADGSVHLILQMPKLVSERGRKCAEKNAYFEIGEFFQFVDWGGNNNGEIVTIIDVNFDGYAFETRVVDPVTGIFGECIFDAIR